MDHVREIRTTRELKNHYALQGRREGGGGGQGGQNTWGPDWLGGAEILIKHLGCLPLT